jgi:tetratricopeptide (TPR) repeat protein
MRGCIAIVLWGLIAGVAGAADVHGAEPPLAAEPEPPPAGVDAAALVTHAKALFLAERYVEAADTLMAAYQQTPRPIYLFNAAQSYRKGNAPKQALAAYEQFIPVAETEQLAAEARTYARDMRTLIDAQERSQTVTLALESERQAAAEKQRALQVEKEQALQLEKARSQRIAAELERAKNPPFYKRALFWGIVSPLLALGTVIAIVAPLSEQSVRDANRTNGGTFTIALPMSP